MSCRIKNIVPPCGYRVEGIASILALDFDDFKGFRFDGDDLYENCLVSAVFRSGEFIEIDAPDTAKYNSTLQNGAYTHTLETFIGSLAADLSATLHLATKRRYLIFFKTKAGRYFSFGYEAGATFSYANQTAEGIGALVTITASSVYPIFEVSENAFTSETPNSEFIPDFNNGAYCETV